MDHVAAGSFLARPILGEKGANSAWWLCRAFGRSLRLCVGFCLATSLPLAFTFRSGKGLVTLLGRESFSAKLLVVAVRAGIPFRAIPMIAKVEADLLVRSFASSLRRSGKRLVRASFGRGSCSFRSSLRSGLETLNLLLSLG